jgi:hypothetical protein
MLVKNWKPKWHFLLFKYGYFLNFQDELLYMLNATETIS